MVSPRGRGIIRGAHNGAALGGSIGEQGGGGSYSSQSNSGGGWGYSGRRNGSGGRGGTAHPRPESMTTAGIHHGWVRGGEEVERGISDGKWRFEMKMGRWRFI